MFELIDLRTTTHVLSTGIYMHILIYQYDNIQIEICQTTAEKKQHYSVSIQSVLNIPVMCLSQFFLFLSKCYSLLMFR